MLRIKRLLIAASLLTTLFALPVVAETTKEVCFSGAATIPNEDNNGVTTNISVGELGVISKIRLTHVSITHGHIGEISASLIHDTKTVHIGEDPGVIALSSDQGCKGQDIANLTIADDGTKFIETDCLVNKPAYDSGAVHQPVGHFSDFNNDQVNGTWSLKVADHHSFNTVPGSVTKWCLEYTRPTNTTITVTPAAAAINLGAAYYPGGVTQDIVIQASTGDAFQISRVEFLSVSSGANGDFIGSITKELPTSAIIASSVKPGSPYTSVIDLSPGDKYHFAAQCKPTGTGTRTATFQITTNLPSPNNVLSFPLTCDGNVGIYSASLTSGSTTNIGSTALGTTINSSFTVKNNGNYVLNLSESHTTDDASVSIQSPGFPLSLALGETKTITVQCIPSVAGTLSRKFTLSSADTPNLSSSVEYTFECAGNAPVASFTPASGTVNVGTVLEGNSITTKVIDVQNNNGVGSTAALTLSNPTFTGGTASAFSLINLPTNIAGNTTDGTGIVVKCDASGLTGAPITGTDYTSTLKFDTNDTTKSTVSFVVSCKVKAPEPIASLNPAPTSTLNFNTVGSSGGTQSISIGNSSSATKALTVTSAGFSPAAGTEAFELLDSSGVAISVGASLSIGLNLTSSISVKCKGNAAPGTYAGTLTLNTDDPTKLTITYPVSCTVADNNNHPLYNSSPLPNTGTAILVGSTQVGTWSGLQTIQVSEIGNAELKVAVDSLSNNTVFAIDSPTLPFTIVDGGAPVDIKIKCKPAAVANTATLTLKATDTSDNPVANYPAPTYQLSCAGLQPAYTSTPTDPGGTISVGTTRVGQSISTTLSVKNEGNASTNLTVDAPTVIIDGANPNDFSISGLPITIAKGSTKNLTITCSPTATDARTATLHLTTNDPNKPTVIYTLNCTGQEAIGTVYSSDPAVLKDTTTGQWRGEIDFGDVLLNTAVQKTLTISESGSTVLNVGKPATATDFLTGDSNITVNDTLFVLGGTVGTSIFNPGFFISDGGAAQVITLTCQPTALGTHTATLKLRTDDKDTSKSTITYTLTCHGIKSGYSSTPAPASTLNCGGTTTQTGNHATETLRVAETGNVDLVVNSAGFSGTNASDFSMLSPNFPFTITEGSPAQDIRVQFTPTATGTRTATLTLSSNDPDNSSIAYKFSCQATSPAVPPSTEVVLQTLAITLNPDGGGKVDSNLGDIHCGEETTACHATFDIDTEVALTVTPATGYQFKAWSGDCTTNTVTLNKDKTCTANFELIPTDEKPPVETETPTTPGTPTTPPTPPVVQPPVVPPVIQPPVVQPTPPTTDTGETEGSHAQSTAYTLSVSTSGKGSGKISGSGINCGDGGNGQCNQTVAAHTQITLSAQPLPGSTFLGWSGSCEGNTAIVTLNMIANKQCVARFELLATQPEKEDDGLGNYCTGQGYTNISCNARGAVIGDVDGKIEVDTGGYLANGIVTKPLTNKGWVANLTIEDTGSLTGGIVTGTIVNNGEMSNFEFRGDVLSGGKLSGVIKNNSPNVCFADGIVRGVIKNVTLAANTRILGGRVSGEIKGDSQSPAHLANVIVTGKTTLSNVLLEENVIIEQDVLHETTQMTKVKLAPNIKMQGGKISGELSGDATAPAHLSNMLINAGTTLENVILDDNVEIADEKVCANQALAATPSQDTPETATTENNAILLNSEGNQLDSTSRFDIELVTSQGKRPNKAVLSPEAAKTVDLAVHLTVQREHVGSAAELLIVVQTKNTEQTMNYMKTATGWTLWDGQLSHLQPLETYQKLPEIIDLSVFTGDLSQESGEFSLYAGYRLTDGTLVFNGRNPLRFAVTRTVEACALTCGCQ